MYSTCSMYDFMTDLTAEWLALAVPLELVAWMADWLVRWLVDYLPVW